MLSRFKNRRGRRSTKWDGYFRVYERHLFAPVVLWEIGVLKGGSLQFWKELYPNSAIVGIDIDPKCFFEEENIHVRIGSQSDLSFLQSVLDEFGYPDIVIDDGGHRFDQQKASLEFLFPQTKLYVVEDADTTFVEYAKEWIGRACVGFYPGMVTFEPDYKIHKIDSGG